MKAIILE